MSEQESPYQVLLYYLYTPIEDPEAFRDEHRTFCEEHGLLGRILIGKEGINGTLSGTTENCQKYVEYMHGDPRTEKTEFKTERPNPVFSVFAMYVRSRLAASGGGVGFSAGALSTKTSRKF